MSPACGSTLMTSAPKSASRRPAMGPAIRLVISKTRMPCRGRSNAVSGSGADDAAAGVAASSGTSDADVSASVRGP